MNTLLLDLTTAWLLKGMMEAMHNIIDMHSAKVVARWFGGGTKAEPNQRCPYGELGWQFEDLIAETFSEEFVEKWYAWNYID